MEEWLKVLILGLVEGITEFLPVSSTGHLIVVSDALKLRDSLRGTFEIFIQIGAVVAVLAYYRHQLLTQVKTVRHNAAIQHLWLSILVAFIPAAAIGFVFSDWIDSVLLRPLPVALALVVGGVMFLLIERQVKPYENPPSPEQTEESVQKITFKQALWIGTWQVFALFPGMSRSGMSIMGGLTTGLSRTVATQFSFYLAIPTLGLATIYKLISDLDQITRDDMAFLIVGAIISGIVAWFSIAWLLRYVARHNFVPFGWYRIGLGVFILVLLATGSL